MPVTVERQVQLWFEARSDAFAIAVFRLHALRGRPDLLRPDRPSACRRSSSAATTAAQPVHPDTVGRDVTAGDEEHVRAWAREHLPEAAGARLLDAKVCLYTNTADANFPHRPGARRRAALRRRRFSAATASSLPPLLARSLLTWSSAGGPCTTSACSIPAASRANPPVLP
jgi:hypothetical protein